MADNEEEEADEMLPELDEDEDEEEEEAEEEEHEDAMADTTAIKEVQDKTFEEVKFSDRIIEEVQNSWASFTKQASSREAAAEAIYSALFDSAPSLQGLFKTPRAVMSIRILNGFATIVGSMATPGPLKTSVETLGFQHLDLEVTVPRVVIFRDAVIDLLEMELEVGFTSKAKAGWMSLLNYVGGAFIYVRVNYSERLKIIAASWAVANNKKNDELQGMDGDEEGEEKPEGAEGEEGEEEDEEEKAEEENHANRKTAEKGELNEEQDGEGGGGKSRTMKVPTTFNEMFTFNSAVMGFGSSLWMSEILDVFDDIVKNVSNSYRLQETCDTLGVTLAKYKGSINLAEFKAVMLASLRSLVPKDWGTGHEVAWSWLWDNVERMLKALTGKPQVMERGLERFILSLTEDSVNYLRRELYKRFFALAPAGQDFFKQSTTRLYWIADRVVELTIEMYRDPKKMVNDLSALGLRHVGYGVLTEFFAPYVSGAVEVVRSMTTEENAQEGFKWSLSLMGRILVRTINEGSTIVMKAVNNNSEKTLRKAVAVAPRGRRAMWMLNITVGTQSISPLYWAIESGSLNTANAMIKDLLVIRADRENYYYGCHDLFERHPDIIQRLCADAPALLWTLFNGLIWRSRITTQGERRVNYYVKHLLQDKDGKFSPTLDWLVQNKDPKIVCHPVVTFFSDLVWNRVANMKFLFGWLYVMFTLVVFILSQSVLQHIAGGQKTQSVRIATFLCRCFIYIGSLGQFLRSQVQQLREDCRERRFFEVGPLKIPEYLSSVKQIACLLLLVCLVLLMIQEPSFHCLGSKAPASRDGNLVGNATTDSTDDSIYGLFTQECPEGRSTKEAYKTISMLAMSLYWFLLTDLTIFSMSISAYALVIGRVLSEVGLFLGALVFLIGTFSTSVSVLAHQSPMFEGVPRSALSLYEIALGMFDTAHFAFSQRDGTLAIALCAYVIVTTIFLLQLLIAQLNGAYTAHYDDMVGYARLNRGKVIVITMQSVSQKRWGKFLKSLRLDEKLEFNEGDIGLAGGIQVLEPANLHPTRVDSIVRFGGSTSPAMQWPEDNSGAADDEDDKYERLQKQLSRISKKADDAMAGGKKPNKTGVSSMGGSGSHGSSSQDEDE
eukprot:TRINITY_DN3498_c0_g1_i1.p1 TRINITY_DN3498_c0_g1~~TRINITY_DN3498_c0_g1_i1.p1  ORF type:complete len:1119 (+),score=213.89 TRINITY_DN3498_c0_g1_i1:76-3432(+)